MKIELTTKFNIDDVVGTDSGYVGRIFNIKLIGATGRKFVYQMTDAMLLDESEITVKYHGFPVLKAKSYADDLATLTDNFINTTGC